ncbi:hypothetical protein ACWCYY_38655 [Kitasatospora sp. NPDC001664]
MITNRATQARRVTGIAAAGLVIAAFTASAVLGSTVLLVTTMAMLLAVLQRAVCGNYVRPAFRPSQAGLLTRLQLRRV